MFLARELEHLVPEVAQEGFPACPFRKEYADQHLAVLLQLFGQFEEADLPLIEGLAGGPGVLVPDKSSDGGQEPRPHFALHPILIGAGQDLEAQHTFPLFKNQLHLPAHAIKVSCRRQRQPVGRGIGQQDQPTGQFECLGAR